jgi:hypothetical protein
MSFQKISFYTLLLLVLISGYLLVSSTVIKTGMIDAKGRVVEREEDSAIIRFAAENRDSITVRTKIVYTKDKLVLYNYDTK